jgi:hypothetical protein
MALHGGVIVGGDIYILTTFNSAPLTSHDTMWERTIGPIFFLITQNLAHVCDDYLSIMYVPMYRYCLASIASIPQHIPISRHSVRL